MVITLRMAKTNLGGITKVFIISLLKNINIDLRNFMKNQKFRMKRSSFGITVNKQRINMKAILTNLKTKKNQMKNKILKSLKTPNSLKSMLRVIFGMSIKTENF